MWGFLPIPLIAAARTSANASVGFDIEMRTLNIRLLVILLVGALLTAAVGYGVHGFQVRRNAGTLLRQAAAAKESEE